MQWIPEDKKEPQEPVAWMDEYGDVLSASVVDGSGLRNIPLYTAPPQPKPEQELVAWRNAAIRVGEDLCSVGPFGYYDMTAKQWLDWALSVVTIHAPPPQRTWFGLTDEERESFWKADQMTQKEWDELFTAIEAKLKQKNGFAEEKNT
jgi:hypothetical protein